MSAESLVERILEDEGLTSDLDEAEATVLINWLVKRAEAVCAADPKTAETEVGNLRRFGRSVSRVVATWRDEGASEAGEKARKAKLPWPPKNAATAGDVLNWLLAQAPNASSN